MDMLKHKQHVEREGMTRRKFLRDASILGGAGLFSYLGVKYGNSTISKMADELFPETLGNVQKMDYKVGDVIKGRKITSPAVVAEIVSENPMMSEVGGAGNPAYLTQMINDFPENAGYRGRWNKLQHNDVFTGIDWKTPYRKK